MRNAALAVLLTLFIGCRWDALGPSSHYCAWHKSSPATVSDTIWNTLPNPDYPFLVVTQVRYTDSTQVCH